MESYMMFNYFDSCLVDTDSAEIGRWWDGGVGVTLGVSVDEGFSTALPSVPTPNHTYTPITSSLHQHQT